MTIPIWTPMEWTSLISAAMRRTNSESMPKFCSPIRTSPLSFNRTLLYFGSKLLAQSLSDIRRQIALTLFQSFARLEPGKATNTNVFADFTDERVDQVFDRLRRIFDELLIVQTGHL